MREIIYVPYRPDFLHYKRDMVSRCRTLVPLPEEARAWEACPCGRYLVVFV